MRQGETTPAHSDAVHVDEVHSSRCYPKTYRGARCLTKQIHRLADEFAIDRSQALALAGKLPDRPNRGEGWFAFPKVSLVARRHFPTIKDPGEQYCRVIDFGHEILGKYHPFVNYSSITLTPESTQPHPRTSHFVAQIEAEQPGGIVIVAAQHGLRHRGRSTMAVRRTIDDDEFGLGSFWVTCMGITHPERYHDRYELDTECPGDCLCVGAKQSPAMVPHYSFSGGKLGYSTGDVSDAYERFGPVTGFLVK